MKSSDFAPVVHETLKVLEEHVLVFVQDPLDGIPARWEEVSKKGWNIRLSL